jgi:hypothetical protein
LVGAQLLRPKRERTGPALSGHSAIGRGFEG